jgi:hypothetical protein
MGGVQGKLEKIGFFFYISRKFIWPK